LKCFLAYIKREGKSISRAQFERNLALKKRDDRFLEDTRPLLASIITWDPGEALDFVGRELVSHLPGEPWKGTKRKE